MKNNKKNAVVAFLALAITALTLNIGLINNDVYSKAPEKKGTLMEGSLGTFCCCPGTLDCGAAECSASACKSVIKPPNPN
jgi:hypothetical protein